MSDIAEQPAPVPNTERPIWDQVIEDMHARDTDGRAEYGTPLQAHNGRKPLVDLYQELLDAVAYTKQQIIEDDARREAADAMAEALRPFVTMPKAPAWLYPDIDRAVTALAAWERARGTEGE